MNCPKCNSKMIDNCCIKCGYMSNGNTVTMKSIDKNNDLKIYNENYDVMLHNSNSLIVFMFGMSYLAYGGYVFYAIVGGILEFFLFFAYTYLISYIPLGNFFHFLSMLMYIIITRYLCASFLNSLCLYLDKRNIDKLKEKYKDYKGRLVKGVHGYKGILLVWFIYFVILFILILYKRMLNGLI